jgi:hypothetical protein
MKEQTQQRPIPTVCSDPTNNIAKGLFVSNDWITKGKIKLLWLPPDYRATCVAVWNRIVVLGHSSGRVSVFAFNEG